MEVLISAIYLYYWEAWLLLGVLCLVFELVTGGIFFICFSLGSFFAMAASIYGGFGFQLLVFFVFSLLPIFVIRPLVLHYITPDDKYRPTNTEALFGQIGYVTQAIKAKGHGRVAVDGDDWKAKEEKGLPLEVGAKIKVVDRKGLTLIVAEAVDDEEVEDNQHLEA